jgi:hypothetical protein
MPGIEVAGVDRVDAPEPVHLVELRVLDGDGSFDFGDITQETLGQPRSDWQVPYLEHIVDATGTRVLADDRDARDRPELWIGEFRLAFFFHDLDPDRPLITPYGTLPVLAESPLPDRLSMIRYETP